MGATRNGGSGRRGSSLSSTCWPPCRSTTGGTPTASTGRGPTIGCASGSRNMPGEFVAGLRCRTTRKWVAPSAPLAIWADLRAESFFVSMRRHGAKNAGYRGGVTCLYDTQLLGACLHATECGGRSRPEAVRGMPDVPIAPPATGPPEGWAAVGFVGPASFNRGLWARLLRVLGSERVRIWVVDRF